MLAHILLREPKQLNQLVPRIRLEETLESFPPRILLLSAEIGEFGCISCGLVERLCALDDTFLRDDMTQMNNPTLVLSTCGSEIGGASEQTAESKSGRDGSSKPLRRLFEGKYIGGILW